MTPTKGTSTSVWCNTSCTSWQSNQFMKAKGGMSIYSMFFTVPKRNGDLRSIRGLKFTSSDFWMETLKSIIEALQPGQFMSSLDLIEASLHVLILPAHWKFLRSCLGESHFQFKVQPFGLLNNSRVFTKLLVNPIASLRMQGIHVHPYFDDLLILSLSRTKAIQVS